MPRLHFSLVCLTFNSKNSTEFWTRDFPNVSKDYLNTIFASVFHRGTPALPDEHSKRKIPQLKLDNPRRLLCVSADSRFRNSSLPPTCGEEKRAQRNSDVPSVSVLLVPSFANYRRLIAGISFLTEGVGGMPFNPHIFLFISKKVRRCSRWFTLSLRS